MVVEAAMEILIPFVMTLLVAILTPVVMVVEAAMEILIPFVMTLLVGVIEGAQEEGRNLVREDFVRIAIYGGIMFVLGLVSLASGVLGGKLASEASAGFAANLRQDAYDKIQTFSFANIDRFSTSSLITRLTTDTSSLITRLTTDITSVQMSFQMSIRMLVRAPVMFLFASVMSFIIEPQIAWIFLVAAAILFVLVLLIMNAAQPNFRQMFKKYDRLNAVAQENLTGIRVVKSYVLEGQEIDKYQKATQEVYNYSVRAEKLMAAMSPVVQVIMYTTMIILLSVGGVSIVGRDLGIAVFRTRRRSFRAS